MKQSKKDGLFRAWARQSHIIALLILSSIIFKTVKLKEEMVDAVVKLGDKRKDPPKKSEVTLSAFILIFYVFRHVKNRLPETMLRFIAWIWKIPVKGLDGIEDLTPKDLHSHVEVMFSNALYKVDEIENLPDVREEFFKEISNEIPDGDTHEQAADAILQIMKDMAELTETKWDDRFIKMISIFW